MVLSVVYLALSLCVHATSAAPVVSDGDNGSFTSGNPLKVISYAATPNGFNGPPRGWNSFGLQANPVNADFKFDQSHVQTQCDAMADKLSQFGYNYCSLDSGWSVGGNGDEYGRIIYDSNVFDIPKLADHLHNKDLKLGLYVVPGAFIADRNKTIYSTETKIGDVCDGDEGLVRCVFDYTRPEVQTWHNSVADLFASWEVDFVKLDFVTPGSPDNGQNLPADQSACVVAWHKAIEQCGRQMRLDISWKLDRTEKYFTLWSENADSMRTDQDINNGGKNNFTEWEVVQRAIDNYRQWIVAGLEFFNELPIYPDLDNLYVGNQESQSGVNDVQRRTMMTHWVGSGGNLILGSDLTQLDDYGLSLIADKDVQKVSEFTAQYPMQPRNPGTGGQDAKQLQAWIAGPSPEGEAVVVLANYGPDQGQGGFGTSDPGSQKVSVSWKDLGITGTYHIQNVWQKKDLGNKCGRLTVNLGPGESALFQLRRN